MNLYRKPTSFVNNDVEQKCCNLTDYRCIGGALHPHSRTAQKSENHNRIQDNINDRPCGQQDHRDLHFPDSLEDLLKSNLKQTPKRQTEDNISIIACQIHDAIIFRKHSKKRPCHKDTKKHKQDAVNHCQCHSNCCRLIRPFLSPCAQVNGYGRTDPHSNSNGYGCYHILQRIRKGNRCQCIRSKPRHINTVDNIIQ